jgi:hypothetical protein
MNGETVYPVEPASLKDSFDEGGESACWAHLVCPQCGRLNAAQPPVRCEGCGAAFPALD